VRQSANTTTSFHLHSHALNGGVGHCAHWLLQSNADAASTRNTGLKWLERENSHLHLAAPLRCRCSRHLMVTQRQVDTPSGHGGLVRPHALPILERALVMCHHSPSRRCNRGTVTMAAVACAPADLQTLTLQLQQPRCGLIGGSVLVLRLIQTKLSGWHLVLLSI
jgi:hypothetical protein